MPIEPISRRRYATNTGTEGRECAPRGKEVEGDFATYHEALAQAHHAALHGTGVATGLAVTIPADRGGVSVGPGVGVTPSGKLVVLPDAGKALVGDSDSLVSVPVLIPAPAANGLHVLTAHPLLHPQEDAAWPCGRFVIVARLRLTAAAAFNPDPDAAVLGICRVAGGEVVVVADRDPAVPGAVVTRTGESALRQQLDALQARFNTTIAQLQAQVTALLGRQLNTSVFTSSGSWTAPGNVTRVLLLGYGGGGGGGGGSGGAGNGVLDTFPCGGGGGGGAHLTSTAASVTPGTTYPVTIGAGSSGGAGGGPNTDGSDGGHGGDTTFGSLATFKGATGGIGGSRTRNTSPTAFLLAAGGSVVGALRPPPNMSVFSDPFRTLANGNGAGGDGTDNKPSVVPRNGTTSVEGFQGGSGALGGSDSGTIRGGGPGGGGGGGPGGVGGNGGTGGEGSGTGGWSGTNGNAAGPLGVPVNTGAGGGGGGAGGSSSSGEPGGTGGKGGAGGSGKLTIVYAA